jgi:hypothetical protein
MSYRGLYLRNEIWYSLYYQNGKRVRKSTGCSTLESAIEWQKQNVPKKVKKRKQVQSFSELIAGEPFVVTKKFITDMYWRIKDRSGGDTMTRKELVELIESAQGRCQMTGIPFVAETYRGADRKPFIPSIDRINPKLPYTKENCRIVCLAVNIGMNQWGERLFDELAKARVKVLRS